MALAGDLAVWGCWPAVSRLAERLAGRMPATTTAAAGTMAPPPARRRWRSWVTGRRLPVQEIRPDRASQPAAPVPGPGQLPAAGSTPGPGGEHAAPLHLPGELQVVLGERPVTRWVSV